MHPTIYAALLGSAPEAHVLQYAIAKADIANGRWPEAAHKLSNAARQARVWAEHAHALASECEALAESSRTHSTVHADTGTAGSLSPFNLADSIHLADESAKTAAQAAQLIRATAIASEFQLKLEREQASKGAVPDRHLAGMDSKGVRP